MRQERSEPARERRIALYKSDQQQPLSGWGGDSSVVRAPPDSWLPKKVAYVDFIEPASALVTTCP